jgi:type II secretory pathway component GspD/PulD (secretin)
MWLTKLKTVTAVFLLVCLLGAALTAGILTRPGQAADPVKSPKKEAADKNAAKEDVDPKSQPPKPDPKWTNLERRLDRLQTQLLLLTREVQALRTEFKPPKARTARMAEIKLFSLKHAQAGEVAKTLKELLRDSTDKSGRTTRTVLRIATHASTNTILIQGTSEDLEAVEAILTRLDIQSADSK